MENNYLHFDSDIIDIVYKKFHGKYTHKQIADVLDCSVSYIHHLLTYTDTLSVYVRHIGFYHTSRKDLNRRHKLLKSRFGKRGAVKKKIQQEMKSVENKIDILKSDEYNNHPVNRDARFCMKNNLRRGVSWDYIQDFQNNIKF